MQKHFGKISAKNKNQLNDLSACGLWNTQVCDSTSGERAQKTKEGAQTHKKHSGMDSEWAGMRSERLPTVLLYREGSTGLHGESTGEQVKRHQQLDTLLARLGKLSDWKGGRSFGASRWAGRRW